jgi:hypothetical protein
VGWSNEIPNPLIVGGGGQSGEIDVYDAAGNLIMVIDEDGLVAGNALPAGPYTWLSPNGVLLIDQFGDERGTYWFDPGGDSVLSVDLAFVNKNLSMGGGTSGLSDLSITPGPPGTPAEFLVDADDGLRFFPNPGGPTDAVILRNGPWLVPLGRLAYAQITAPSAAFTALANVAGLSVTFDVPSGVSRNVKIESYCLSRSTVAADTITFQINDGGGTSQVTSGNVVIPAANQSVGRTISVIETLAPGTYTYRVAAQRATGTGTTVINAAATSPSYIMASDIGGV